MLRAELFCFNRSLRTYRYRSSGDFFTALSAGGLLGRVEVFQGVEGAAGGTAGRL